MAKKLWQWLEDRWYIRLYGMTKQQIIDEYVKEVKFQKELRRIWLNEYRDYADVDHYMQFGDK